jgi:hypothetical protein
MNRGELVPNLTHLECGEVQSRPSLEKVECRWLSEFTPRLERVVLDIYRSRIVAIYKFYSKLSETHCVNTDAGVADIPHARYNYPGLQLILLVLISIPKLLAFPDRPPSETEGTF